MKNKKLLVLFVVVAALIGAGVMGGIIIAGGLGRATTDDAYIEGRIHSVAAKIPGTVKRVVVADNQGVAQGAPLVELDTADYELKVLEARAAVDAENARLRDSEAGIKTAAANLNVQEVTLKQAFLDRRRAQALFKEEVITQEKHERASTAYLLAAAQLKAAREHLEKARALKAVEESLVRQKEAALKIAELNLSYTRIMAPSAGYVTRRSVEEGNQVQAGQPLMAVVALNDLWIVANFKETQLKNVRPGQKVSIKVDTYPGRVFTGTVDSIMAGTGSVFSLFPPENALGNYVKVVQRVPVKIVFDTHSTDLRGLRIGMSCLPTITTRHE